MDRLEFSESIGIDPELQLREYFNEIMGMYNLFGEFENISIKGSVKGQTISFDLLFKDQKEAKDLGSAINNTVMRIYDSMYIIHSSSSNKTVNIYLENII